MQSVLDEVSLEQTGIQKKGGGDRKFSIVPIFSHGQIVCFIALQVYSLSCIFRLFVNRDFGMALWGYIFIVTL